VVINDALAQGDEFRVVHVDLGIVGTLRASEYILCLCRSSILWNA
jgi:hypothetical protein